MCGIVGFTNYKRNLKKDEGLNILNTMNEKLNKRGPDESGIYDDDTIYIGHNRLAIIDIENGKQPMRYIQGENEFVITYNGQIYNTKELRDELEKEGYEFSGHSDTEVLLKAFVHYGYEVAEHLNGIFAFAIWNKQRQELFLARDHFGVKPLYYAIKNNELIFASEIKALFEYPSIYPCIDKNGIAELFGIGPAHTAQTTAFKEIYELKPASYLIYNKDGFYTNKYWKLKSEVHKDSFEETCNNVKYLLKDSIERQLVSDVNLCTFLSGGLDSSIISYYANKYYIENKNRKIDTYSVDYKDNDINFQRTDFQPNTDSDYVQYASKEIGTNHHIIMLDTPELYNALKEAVIARDLPGMADVDSSLLLFSREVKKEQKVAISGECADEIFGGYPWFFREDALNSNTFPWSINIEGRQHLLNPKIASKINLKEYIDYRYNESLAEVEILEEDTKETIEKRKISYLTCNWFMQTLLDRTDRMAMYNGLEIRVPFCDYRLAQYVWNIPWEIKSLNDREKGLLRFIMQEELPEKIIKRKKSPYPKTWNPSYMKMVKTNLTQIINNKKSPILELLNEDDIKNIIATEGKSFSRPWFGQLMTGAQLMAYLIQVNMWLEIYKPAIEL